jgi:hypothetical protein
MVDFVKHGVGPKKRHEGSRSSAVIPVKVLRWYIPTELNASYARPPGMSTFTLTGLSFVLVYPSCLTIL